MRVVIRGPDIRYPLTVSLIEELYRSRTPRYRARTLPGRSDIGGKTLEEIIKALVETQSRLERKNAKTGDIDLTPEIERIQELTQELSDSIQPKKAAATATKPASGELPEGGGNASKG